MDITVGFNVAEQVSAVQRQATINLLMAQKSSCCAPKYSMTWEGMLSCLLCAVAQEEELAMVICPYKGAVWFQAMA